MEDLRERLLACINSFTRTMAKPFQWTDTGRPLTAYSDGVFLPGSTRDLRQAHMVFKVREQKSFIQSSPGHYSRDTITNKEIVWTSGRY